MYADRAKPLEYDDKWALDIALDCIRTMKDDDRELIKKEKKIPFYHFGYGLYVRNKYVHIGKKHECFIADDISSRVEDFIYDILVKESI